MHRFNFQYCASVAVAVCCLFSPLVAANRATTIPASDTILLNFPENLEVKVLIEYVGRQLGINIIYDDVVGRKRVTISSPSRIPKQSLMGLLQSVLKMAELSLVDAEQPGWKKVVPDKDLLALAKNFSRSSEDLSAASATSIVTQVFTLKNTTVNSAEQAIKPFLSKPGGNCFSIAEQNIVIVTDYADCVRKVASLVDLVDKPGRKTSINFVPVRNMDTAELARQVMSLLRDRAKVAGAAGAELERSIVLTPDLRTNQIVVISTEGMEKDAVDLIQKLDVPIQLETQTYVLKHVSPQRIDRLAQELSQENGKSRYKSTVDADSGLLIVTAPSTVHEQIAAIAKRLDVPGAAQETGHVRFYKLMNSTASEVLATIRAMDSGEKGLSGVAVAAAQPDTEQYTGPNNPPAGVGQPWPTPPAYHPTSAPSSQPAESLDTAATTVTAKTKDATITADLNTNSIIIIAPPAVQAVYKQIISMLDKRRPQVLIEVTLVTIDTSNDFSLGVELGRKNEWDDNKSIVFSSFGLSTIDPKTGEMTITPGTGFNGVLLAPDVLNVVVKALATSAKSNVLSAPKVLVNDNGSATLSSIAESPYTSINASQTVATTSFAGYASAGTTITVTPHISEGDHLQLQYAITLNSFTGQGSSTVPPPRQTNAINSQVTVPDGYAVIIGGLNRKDTSESVSKVPFLGDIPGAGYLFSSRTNSDKRSTLFAFIRPIILRDDQFEDLKYFSERDLRSAGLEPNIPDPTLLPMK